MNRVEIVAVGNEILSGRIQDSNSNWLAREITALGGEVCRVIVVPDTVEDIVREMKLALTAESRIIVTTGGLGPTFDDKTLEAVAQALDRPLALDFDAFEWILQTYEDLKKDGFVDSDNMTNEREKMAHLPDGSTPLPNRVGAAPGIMVDYKSSTIFCLPGVPAEMTAIFEDHIKERLQTLFAGRIFVERNITTDIGDESKLVPVINEVMKKMEGVYAKSKPSRFGENVHIGIRLTTTGGSEADGEAMINEAVSCLEAELLKVKGRIIDYK